MVFDRSANTPRNAKFTEPERVIAGPNTTLEFDMRQKAILTYHFPEIF